MPQLSGDNVKSLSWADIAGSVIIGTQFPTISEDKMTPRQAAADTHSIAADLFCERPDNLLNQRHELYYLAGLIGGGATR